MTNPEIETAAESSNGLDEKNNAPKLPRSHLTIEDLFVHLAHEEAGERLLSPSVSALKKEVPIGRRTT